MPSEQHFPVMAGEVIEFLAVKPEGTYLDCTCGLGGHAAEIARRLSGQGRLIARDRDALSLNQARQNLAEFSARIVFEQGNFSTLPESLHTLGIAGVDGVLADLGVSRYQLLAPERGFGFSNDGPLDMRMDSSQGATAADIVNFASEEHLANLIFRLGEERRSRRIARAIVQARPVRTTRRLADVIERAVPRTSRAHPATQTFQALRMVVNNELEEVEALMDALPGLVNSSGRAVVITFHSLEDRIVKRSFQAWARRGTARLLTKHVVTASVEETRSNPASRPAKLRALEVIEKEPAKQRVEAER